MGKIEREIIERRYLFTQKELKRKLGIKGDIDKIGIWRGLSPNEEKEGVSVDDAIFYIEAIEHIIESEVGK
jgi:hypothetical protein